MVVDYTHARFERELHDYDGVFDLVGGETLRRSFEVIKPGGMVVSIAGMPEPTTARKDLRRGAGLALLFWIASASLRREARRHRARYRYLFMHESGAELAELAGLLETGHLKVITDRVFPFGEIAQAMAYLESGHAKGKVVVRMAD